MSTKSAVQEWREWFQTNVQPGLDKLPVLDKPCPNCSLTYGEEGATCGYCFICHGRNYCGCDGPEDAP